MKQLINTIKESLNLYAVRLEGSAGIAATPLTNAQRRQLIAFINLYAARNDLNIRITKAGKDILLTEVNP